MPRPQVPSKAVVPYRRRDQEYSYQQSEDEYYSRSRYKRERAESVFSVDSMHSEDVLTPTQNKPKFAQRCWAWIRNRPHCRALFRFLQVLVISVPVGLCWGIRFPNGPSSLGPDESGILTPPFLVGCGFTSSLFLVYSLAFGLMHLCCEEWFFDWVDMHPPIFAVLTTLELAMVFPVGICAAYLFYKTYEGTATVASFVCVAHPQAKGCAEVKAMSFLLGYWALAQLFIVVWLCSRIWRYGGEDFKKAYGRWKAQVDEANEEYKRAITRLRGEAKGRTLRRLQDVGFDRRSVPKRGGGRR